MAHGEERTYSHGIATHRRRRCRLRHVAAIAEARRKGGGADARGVEDAPLPARLSWQAGAERRAAAARPRRRAFPQDDRRRDCDMPPAAEAARRRCGGGNPHGQARGIHDRLSVPFTNSSSPHWTSARPSQAKANDIFLMCFMLTFPCCVRRRRRVYHNSRPDEAMKPQLFREVYANVYFAYTCGRPRRLNATRSAPEPQTFSHVQLYSCCTIPNRTGTERRSRQ